MEIRIESQTCEICGRRLSDFKHSAFRNQYKCPKCERIVCCVCYYQHKCGRRLCAWCLSNSLRWRKSRTEYYEHKCYNYSFDVFEHPWGAPVCSMCGRTDKWYCLYELINLGL